MGGLELQWIGSAGQETPNFSVCLPPKMKFWAAEVVSGARG